MQAPTTELVKLAGKRPVERSWLTASVTKEEAEAHLKGGGSLGLRCRHHPVLDVDVDRPELAELIVSVLLEELGYAPRRTRSNSAKTALVYATDEPMRKQKLVIEDEGAVEVLGDGQQAMILGKHPSGVMVGWDRNPLKEELPTVTPEAIEKALEKLTSVLTEEGHEVRRSGRGEDASAPAQTDLLAPTAEQALDALRAIDVNAYALRDEWLQVLAAVKASVDPSEHDAALEAVQEWSSEWESGNDPSYVEETWKSLRAPYRVGWQYLADHAGVLPFTIEPALEAPVQEQEIQKLYTLAELMRNPELLELPESISPLLGYEGRLTVLSGREKLAGKSTLASWDCASASHTHPVLWVTYEESLGDIVRRFARFGADGERTLIFDRPTAPEIESAIDEHGCAVVYIDSFASYINNTHGKAPATHESEAWQGLTLQLKDLAYRTGAAVITLAHTSKSDDEGGIRGSTGIAAAADQIARIATPRKSDPDDLRRITFIGRWTIESVDVRHREDGFITEGEPEWPTERSLDAEIFAFIDEANAPPSLRVIREGVKGRNVEIAAAIERLVGLGAVEREKGGRSTHHYAIEGWMVSADGQSVLPSKEEMNGELAGGDDV